MTDTRVEPGQRTRGVDVVGIRAESGADRQAASADDGSGVEGLELVTESQNLGLKPGFGPPADQERVEEEANGSVEEGEGHGEDA